jgi:phosphomannomutase
LSETSLKFGTSGLRGLAAELNGPPAYAYSLAFMRMLRDRQAVQAEGKAYVGRDLRSSSPGIARLCHAAIADAGLVPVDCGALPTPALSFYAMERAAPAIMVTGSHIPDDRNGLKFYRSDGEIDKQDEKAILRVHEALGASAVPSILPEARQSHQEPLDAYVARYLDYFAPRCLEGLRVGVYQHSSVARDVLVTIVEALGAEAVPLGRASRFIPVDTEALRAEDIEAIEEWTGNQRFDAIVATDGDADRPLIADADGTFVRGDLVGAITAWRLEADWIVTPVTSNSALEECSRFAHVLRTQVGSPYVIAGMTEAAAAGGRCVVGFEANGGVLLGSNIEKDGRALKALPTRDALLPILSCLSAIPATGMPLSAVAAGFRFKAGASNRLKEVPATLSAPFLARLVSDRASTEGLFRELGGIAAVDNRDGVRISTAAGEVVHFRASGNAPELRCYVEAPAQARADALLAWGLDLARAQITDAET